MNKLPKNMSVRKEKSTAPIGLKSRLLWKVYAVRQRTITVVRKKACTTVHVS